MRVGTLYFNEINERYQVRYDVEDFSNDLHCGDGFEVFISGEWMPTRIEMGEGWYLVGLRQGTWLQGLRVRT